jgi:hypothetical protein
MIEQSWVSFFRVIVVGLLLLPAMACSNDVDSQSTPRILMFTPRSNETPTRPPPTLVPNTATVTAPASTPTTTVPPSGPAVTNVRFAMEADVAGDLVFPAYEFVYGVTRIYVRFAYQELGNVSELQTAWFLNENLVSSSKLAWDGDEEGEYVIWIEDPTGLGRGEWRLELSAAGDVLGGASFIIGGAPSYVNEMWRVAFDPPPTWEVDSAQEGFVTFSSPDQRQALAFRIGPGVSTLSEAADTEVVVFQKDHPDAEAIATEEVTMNGEPALLTEVRFAEPATAGQESVEQALFIVSALYGDSVYSLWVLGPAEETPELKRLLVSSLLSIRFSPGE